MPPRLLPKEEQRQKMKILTRLLIVAVIAGVIYFVTIGRDDFYRLVDAAMEIIQLVADNYHKK